VDDLKEAILATDPATDQSDLEGYISWVFGIVYKMTSSDVKALDLGTVMSRLQYGNLHRAGPPAH